MSDSLTQGFGTLRSCLWPIHRKELPKFLPMLLIVCLIVFVYDVVRNMKDAVVITAAGSEVIPFIKVWALLPGAILATLLFAKLSSRYSQEKVFYLVISGFLLFYIAFALIIYPARESLHAHQFADYLQAHLPKGLKGLVALCRYWSFVCFYVMSELWGSLVLSVLFWGFANEVTRVGESRRFYSVFCIGANCAAIFAGLVPHILPTSQVNPLTQVKDDWQLSLNILTIGIVLCTLVAMILFRWMNLYVLNDSHYAELHEGKQQRKKKKKLSLRESLSFLSNSKYLIYIALLVVSYNLVLNLVEVIWKDQLRKLYPDTDDYFAYMSGLTTYIGLVSCSTAIVMAQLIQRLGWTRTALITPISMLITSAGFFSFMLFKEYGGLGTLSFLGMMADPLSIAVFFGGAQVCLSKAMKYSVFDSTKEMAFIPLSHDLKLHGKAAIDGVGSRMGKSGGSLIHTVLLMFFGSPAACAPVVACIVAGAITLWIYATKALGCQFEEITAQAQAEEEQALQLKTQGHLSPGVQAALS